MRRGTAKKHAPESGLIGSVCHSGGALLASSKAPKRTSRAAWSGISLLPKLAMRSMLRRGKKRRPRVKDYVGAIDQGTTSTRFMVLDRKSTRLNSSHGYISYAVFCLKKKNITQPHVLYCLCHN